MATDAEKWLRSTATAFVTSEIKKVEAVILKHFGTAEKANRMVDLYPGRYLIATRGDGLFESLLGNTYRGRTLTEKYTLIDNLAPKENPDGD